MTKPPKHLRSVLESASRALRGEGKWFAADQLDAWLKRPKPSKKTRAKSKRQSEKKAKRSEKTATTREIRAACMERDGGRCVHCGFTDALQLDHFEGRGRSESVETCWILCARCHGRKTRNEPSAEFWLKHWQAHCAGHGYSAEEVRARLRIDWVRARSSSLSLKEAQNVAR